MRPRQRVIQVQSVERSERHEPDHAMKRERRIWKKIPGARVFQDGGHIQLANVQIQFRIESVQLLISDSFEPRTDHG